MTFPIIKTKALQFFKLSFKTKVLKFYYKVLDKLYYNKDLIRLCFLL